MSIHSELALDKFVYDQNIMAIALQETGCWNPSKGIFQGRKIFQSKTDATSNSAGVALVIHNSLKPEQIEDITDDKIDAIWCQIRMGNKRHIIGSAYCKPTSGTKELLKNY